MSPNAPYYVILVMTVAPALFIAYDIVLALNKRKGDTYSEVLTAIGKKWIAVIIAMSFLFGLLCGHWWW